MSFFLFIYLYISKYSHFSSSANNSRTTVSFRSHLATLPILQKPIMERKIQNPHFPINWIGKTITPANRLILCPFLPFLPFSPKSTSPSTLFSLCIVNRESDLIINSNYILIFKNASYRCTVCLQETQPA